MARVVSVASIMQQARSQTDTVGSQNPPDSDLLNFINLAFTPWYDLLIEGYGQDYFFTTDIVTTVNGVADIPLPADFYKMRFVDFQLSMPQEAYIPMQPYDEALRDSYNFGSPSAIPGGQNLRLSYNPVAPVLQQYASLFVPSNNGTDGVTLTALTQGPYGNSIQVQFLTPSGSGNISVTSIPHQGIIVDIVPASGATLGSVVTQINTASNWPGLAVQFSASGSPLLADGFSTTIVTTPLGGTTSFDFVNGWERYLIAKGAYYIATRLGRDPTVYDMAANKCEGDLQALIATRDAGSVFVAKDYEAEGSCFMPWFPTWCRGFAYRLQGGNLHLISLGLPS
jgi:hypothetical protein